MIRFHLGPLMLGAIKATPGSAREGWGPWCLTHLYFCLLFLVSIHVWELLLCLGTTPGSVLSPGGAWETTGARDRVWDPHIPLQPLSHLPSPAPALECSCDPLGLSSACCLLEGLGTQCQCESGRPPRHQWCPAHSQPGRVGEGHPGTFLIGLEGHTNQPPCSSQVLLPPREDVPARQGLLQQLNLVPAFRLFGKLLQVRA